MNLLEKELQALENQKIIAEEPQNKELLALGNFTSQEIQKIEEISKKIDIMNSSIISNYGGEIRAEVAKFSDAINQGIRVNETGEVGELLTDLVLKMKGINVSEFERIKSGKKNFISSIPVIGPMFDKAQKLQIQFDNVKKQVEGIAGKMESGSKVLEKNMMLFGRMAEQNKEYFKTLTIMIAAGHLKIKEIESVDIPQLQREMEKTNDPLKVEDFQNLITAKNRFESKIEDLEGSRMLTLQSFPQVRTLQLASVLLIDKMKTAVEVGVPAWKQQFAIALGINDLKGANEVTQNFRTALNETFLKTAELTKTQTLQAVRLGSESIIEDKTIQGVHEHTIQMLEGITQIYKEVKNQRGNSRELRQLIETELKQKAKELS